MASTHSGAAVMDGAARALARVASIAALLAFAATHLLAAFAGVLWACGTGWPWAVLALLAAAGWPLPMAGAAFLGALGAWHLNIALAALLALPQLASWLPGAVAAGLARLRHG